MSRPSLVAAAAVVAAAALCACSRADDRLPTPAATAPKRTSVTVTHVDRAPSASPSAALAAAPWPPAEMQDPDPRMRRFALEQWAREPTESLDVVAAALVDPDESIRERAEQVFEAALARQR
jgi:hypothetical protein